MKDRFAEMRAIKAHMAARDFAAIPDEFLSMRRLWPPGGGLWKRRGHEAELFRAGLGEPAAPGAPVSSDARPRARVDATVPRSVAWLQASLNELIEAGLAVDGSYGRFTTAAVRAFQERVGIEVDGDAG